VLPQSKPIQKRKKKERKSKGTGMFAGPSAESIKEYEKALKEKQAKE